MNICSFSFIALIVSRILHALGEENKWKEGWVFIFFILAVIVFPIIFILTLGIPKWAKIVILVSYLFMASLAQDSGFGDGDFPGGE